MPTPPAASPSPWSGSQDQAASAPDDPALDVAMRKAAVVWITVPGGRTFPAWPLWRDGAVHVLHGGSEQAAPGLAFAASAIVAVPAKGARELLVTFMARVEQLAPESADWAALAPLLLPLRLNLRDPTTAVARWATECSISTLVPIPATGL